MSDTNHVVVVGRLTRDADCRYTKGDRAVGSFGICWNGRRKDASGEWADEAHFFEVTVWGKYAEDKRLVKGARVMVSGQLRLDQWEAADKTKRQRAKINADDVYLLQGPTVKAIPTGDDPGEQLPAEPDQGGVPTGDDIPF
jgi:single-strand DNA-binding protein